MIRGDRVRQTIFLILTIMWMIIIFSFSARPADESQNDSFQAGMVIGDIFIPGFEQWDESARKEFVEKIDYPVRKTAHASEYALLALLVSGVCIQKKGEKTKKKTAGEKLIPWGAATIFAATDEFHQLFVPGRSGQLSDVMLDSVGALAGIVLLTVIQILIRRIRSSFKDKRFQNLFGDTPE